MEGNGLKDSEENLFTAWDDNMEISQLPVQLQQDFSDYVTVDGLISESERFQCLPGEIYESGIRAISVLGSLKTCIDSIDCIDCIDKLHEVIEIVESLHDNNSVSDRMIMFISWLHFRHEFTSVIGWAIPTANMITTVVGWFNTWMLHHPTARFIDMGAGSGAISLLLSSAGLPSDRIIAIDNNTFTYARNFFNVIQPPPYTYSECFARGIFTPEDVLFIAWGYGLSTCVDQFIESGIQCVIIEGEAEGGATHPSANHMQEYDDWTTITVHVTPSCGMRHDYLTYNVKNR